MYQDEITYAPEIIRDFLHYVQVIRGKSKLTVEEYYLDLKTFFRFIKTHRQMVDKSTPWDEIDWSGVDIALIKTITLSDVYEFMSYCINERGNKAATRARKSSTLRTFFGYLTNKMGLLSVNPVQELEVPKQQKKLPKYLTLDECLELLSVIDGPNRERDYCIMTFFLNCGLRLSELCGLNLSDIGQDHTLRVVGKGSKERMVYLNAACLSSLEAYLKVRPHDGVIDKKALFLSSRKKRISNKTVQHMVYVYLEKAGLGNRGMSVHKLRHTAATMMYQHGHVDIRVIKDVLGHENLGTTEIYTHLSNAQMEQATSSNPLAQIKPKK